MMHKIGYTGQIYATWALLSLPQWLKSWKAPGPEAPDIVKSYPCRQRLPVRIFFPGGHDASASSLALPPVFTFHSGGWCTGRASDDDAYCRAFADMHNLLVISLEFSRDAYPAALFDIEALYFACLADESLPIARAAHSPGGIPRIGLLGFSTGANLAMALAQLPSVKASPDGPTALASVYGVLDLSRPAHG